METRRRNSGRSVPVLPYSRTPPLHSFTLIELLVVIAIIALLAALLLPALTRARQSALVVVERSNMHGWR